MALGYGGRGLAGQSTRFGGIPGSMTEAQKSPGGTFRGIPGSMDPNLQHQSRSTFADTPGSLAPGAPGRRESTPGTVIGMDELRRRATESQAALRNPGAPPVDQQPGGMAGANMGTPGALHAQQQNLQAQLDGLKRSGATPEQIQEFMRRNGIGELRGIT